MYILFNLLYFVNFKRNCRKIIFFLLKIFLYWRIEKYFNIDFVFFKDFIFFIFLEVVNKSILNYIIICI